MASFTLGKVSISPRGNYSASASYAVLDLVSNKGGSYLCISANSGIQPGVASNWTTYWMSLTKGITSLEITSPETGKATISIVFSDGTSTSTTIDTTAIGAGSVGNTELAPNAVGTTNIQNSSITRAKLAQDALYSPIENLDSINITSEHMGKTLTNPWLRSATYTLTLTNSANMPKGAELAIYRSGQSASTTVTIVSSGVRFVVCGYPGVLTSGTTLTIPDFFGMVALKKISIADANGGDVWLVTGNVEVV